MNQVDLNCDMGESFGNYSFGHDEKLMQYISSANVACGYHAGDPAIIQATVAAAIKHGVVVGAHPGFPDLQGFGRRNLWMTAAEIYQITIYQLGAIAAFTKVAGTKLYHVKPHGALYNMAAADLKFAEAITAAVFDFDPSLILYGLAGSALIQAGKSRGLQTAEEVFADRTYLSSGNLTPRSRDGALITDPHSAAKQALSMIEKGTVMSVDDEEVKVNAETICIHGDNPDAVDFARIIVASFNSAGIEIKSLVKKNG